MYKVTKTSLPTLLGFLSAPLLVSAQTFKDFLTLLQSILGILVYVIIGIGVVLFFWGLIKYISTDETDKTDAKGLMLWGLITLFVMFAIWGFVALLTMTFFDGDTQMITTEAVPQWPTAP